jgi:hypothetical protein
MKITNEVKTDLKKLIELNIGNWQSYLDESQSSEDLDQPDGQLTIGLNDKGDEWNYQTGDNSFTGGAYCFAHWAVVYFYKDTESEDLFEELTEEIENIEEL